jgi:serine/threonine protein kinase
MREKGHDRELLESLFDQGEALQPPERARWLEQLANSEPELARELASLLEFDDSAARDHLRGIMDRAVADAARTPQWPRQFGAYRVLRTIGSGGMGTVFEAVREQDYHKRVALKVAVSAVGTPAWVERFQQERQILAGLDHPHIARFLDGGASVNGLPFFAMELVEGESITDFVRNRNTALRERIELFRKICAAVSYAHQSLVVHRDLKPANILVTGEGEPKLLDFGLAKLLSPVDPNPGLTQTVLPLMTPSYCSPEQVLGAKITTRVDVYLLGLVLFEVLTGSQAHQLSGSSPAELQHAICEGAPAIPSERAIQAGDPVLARSTRGDLDTIVVKALQKDPERRYQSVDELNDDLGRYLDGLPILARPAAWSYRAAKFVRRNWIPVCAAAAVILTLAGGAVAFAWEARIAERRFSLARQLANVLLFDIHDKVQAMPGAIDLRETISARSVEYLDALSKEAGRNYALRRELAAAYARLASAQWPKYLTAPKQRSDSTLIMLNQAMALLQDMPPSELALATTTEAQLLNRRGQLLRQSGNPEAAQADFERVVALSSACGAGAPALCESRINALDQLLRQRLMHNDWPAYRALLNDLRQTLEVYRTFGNETFYEWHTLAVGLHEMSMLAAQHLYREAADRIRRELPVAERLQARTPLPAEALLVLTRVYQYLGRELRRSGQGSPQERLAFTRKGLKFAEDRVRMDKSDTVAFFELSDTQSEIALAYEPLDKREAARWFQLSINTYLERPDVAVSSLEPRIMFYSKGRNAIRFFLRVHRPDDAVAIARRISSVMSPAMFLKLDLPRSEAVQGIQALWWAGSEAAAQETASAEALWGRAVAQVQEALRKTPADPMIRASAALVFEGWAEWLGSKGRQPESDAFRQQSQALWGQLSAAFPDNLYLRNRTQIARSSRHP